MEPCRYLKHTVATTEPFKSGVIREIDPGPGSETDEQIKGKEHLHFPPVPGPISPQVPRLCEENIQSRVTPNWEC